jgi:hypothetical protein
VRSLPLDRKLPLGWETRVNNTRERYWDDWDVFAVPNNEMYEYIFVGQRLGVWWVRIVYSHDIGPYSTKEDAITAAETMWLLGEFPRCPST